MTYLLNVRFEVSWHSLYTESPLYKAQYVEKVNCDPHEVIWMIEGEKCQHVITDG